jgi:hypothetical protein
LMIPTVLNEPTEDRARRLVRCVLAGFAGLQRGDSSPPRSW